MFIIVIIIAYVRVFLFTWVLHKNGEMGFCVCEKWEYVQKGYIEM